MELTIEITSFCNRQCSYCSSNSNSLGKPLDFKTIENFIMYNLQIIGDHKTKIDRINISGGEPLSHPQFYEILRMCENVANEVWVYTNAIKNLAYNASVIDGVNLVANVPLVPDVTIHMPKNNAKVHLLKFIPQGRGHNVQPLDISISRNMIDPKHCDECEHVVLRADGIIVKAPCKKEIENDST